MIDVKYKYIIESSVNDKKLRKITNIKILEANEEFRYTFDQKNQKINYLIENTFIVNLNILIKGTWINLKFASKNDNWLI